MKNYFTAILLIFATIFFQGCKEVKKEKTFDLQGHRGCRGLMPENSIPAMLKALEIGVNTLEMDVVISKDKQVILSHEPVLSHEICFTENGTEISQDDEKLFNLYKMNYDEIKRCDCGTRPHPRFPTQQKMKISKPLLSEIIDSVENFIAKKSLPKIFYNIEIKSTPETDGTFHPRTSEFCNLVMNVIREKNISDRVIIQSFDIRPLQELHQKNPEIKLAILVENRNSTEKNIEKLGFIPDIYSPDHMLVNEGLMKYAAEKNMKVIPWTVNETEEILSVLNLSVDGIITDYPDKVKEIINEFLSQKSNFTLK